MLKIKPREAKSKMIIPVRDHILIQIKNPAQEQKTNSGIILKTQTVQRQTIGKVLAVGEGRLLEDGSLLPCSVQAGDQVIFYDYAGVVVQPSHQEADTTYLIIKQNDILAIVQNEGDAGELI